MIGRSHPSQPPRTRQMTAIPSSLQPGAGMANTLRVIWTRGRAAMLLTVLAACTLLSFAAGAFDPSAPFGLSWGPVDKVPRPSRETRENNVALLMYRGE